MTDQPRRFTVDDIADMWDLTDTEREYLHHRAELNQQLERHRAEAAAQLRDGIATHLGLE